MVPQHQYQLEKKLVEDLILKKKEAFDYLYEHYAAALFGVINRIVLSDDIANDVLQESFVKIWNNISSYDSGKGSLFTWMLNLCRNRAVDEIRSKAYKKEVQNQNIEDYVLKLDKTNFVESSIDHIGLKTVVQKLRPAYKELIDKVYFEGYTQEETAKELGIPLGTVKTRLRAAMVELREALK
jgi:RNA polymerase sigma-70 factor, ECF subfamily